jgi:hypothetical protein
MKEIQDKVNYRESNVKCCENCKNSRYRQGMEPECNKDVVDWSEFNPLNVCDLWEEQ